MAPTELETMQATVAASPRSAKYAQVVDRESAREILAKKLEEGAAKAASEQAAAEQAKVDASAKDAPAKSSTSSRRRTKAEDGVVEQVVKSSAFKQFMRTAAAEIARGMFGTGRR